MSRPEHPGSSDRPGSDDAVAAGSPPLGSGAPTTGHHILLGLRLPRDRLSVPVIRHLTHHAAREVGVVADITDDIDLAVSEACTNVLRHAGPGDAYDVAVTIGPELCEIRVVDVGRGFDHLTLNSAMAHPNAEEGRGLALMRALMDDVRLTSVPEEGTVVRLVKRLAFDDQAPARRLLLDGVDGPGD